MTSVPFKPVLFGDTIGVTAPASAFEKTAFYRGVRTLERWGYRVKIPEHLFDRTGYLAGTDEKRARQFTEVWTDPEVRVVWCARGGYGCMRILPYLDFDKLCKNPKILVGFSDITVLLNCLAQRCGSWALHGPLVTTLSQTSPEDREILPKLLAGGGEKIWGDPQSTCLVPGSAQGIVLGGNLTTLCHMTGTPWAPQFKDAIVFLEDQGEAPYRIDRMLTQMKLSGMFSGVCGFVIGSFTNCGENKNVWDTISECLADLNVPILAGFGAGHGQANRPFFLGGNAKLDAGDKTLTF